MPRIRSQAVAPLGRWFLRPSDLKLSAAFLLAAQAALAITWLSHRNGPGQWVNIDQQPRREILLHVDINTADAAELSLLPRIGPKLAARIVAWRTQQGSFQSLAELEQVHGIGPKTLAGIRPYLQPLPNDALGPVP